MTEIAEPIDTREIGRVIKELKAFAGQFKAFAALMDTLEDARDLERLGRSLRAQNARLADEEGAARQRLAEIETARADAETAVATAQAEQAAIGQRIVAARLEAGHADSEAEAARARLLETKEKVDAELAAIRAKFNVAA